MIYCESAAPETKQSDDLVVLVSQLRAVGLDAVIPASLCSPKKIGHSRLFDVAPLVTDRQPDHLDCLIVIDADQLSDKILVDLRSRYQIAEPKCVAIGRFEKKQTEIGVRAKLSYVLGNDPRILSTTTDLKTAEAWASPLVGINCRKTVRPDSALPTVLVFAPDLKGDAAGRGLWTLAQSRHFNLIVMCNGNAKQDWLSVNGLDVPFYHFGEVLPAQIAPRIDIFICCQNSSLGYRGKSLVANLAAQGAALLDASTAGIHEDESDAFIRTSCDLINIRDHLIHDIIPALPEIGRTMLGCSFVKRTDPAIVLQKIFGPAAKISELAMARSGKAIDSSSRPPKRQRLIYMPTNGVGLGHAQRTSLIAGQHDDKFVEPVFAAFPSCMKLLATYGFDCVPLVGRSRQHKTAHANDLLNYARLSALSKNASGLVFDGGYVFDSVFRTILDHDLASVWIRRGLWQPGQDNSVALDREKIFSRVIVPDEAFEELNETYSRGDHVRRVGPIVQTLQLENSTRDTLRRDLARRFERDFDYLVVTMLGGGVAANRAAQTQAICGMFEEREDTLNLVVVWPTATVEAAIFSWANSRVVKTHHASPLMAASDLFISAAGYNSFHEALYNRIPTIFLPQMNTMMDDQQMRARVATDREIAAMVEPDQLATLESEISEFLDHGKAEDIRLRLRQLDLPESGATAAAIAIEEVLPCKTIGGVQSSVALVGRKPRISMI